MPGSAWSATFMSVLRISLVPQGLPGPRKKSDKASKSFRIASGPYQYANISGVSSSTPTTSRPGSFCKDADIDPSFRSVSLYAAVVNAAASVALYVPAGCAKTDPENQEETWRDPRPARVHDCMWSAVCQRGDLHGPGRREVLDGMEELFIIAKQKPETQTMAGTISWVNLDDQQATDLILHKPFHDVLIDEVRQYLPSLGSSDPSSEGFALLDFKTISYISNSQTA